MDNKYNQAVDILNKYNQNHVINFLKLPNGNINYELVEQVLKIDFEQLKELYQEISEDIYVDLEEIHPIAGVKPDKLPKEEKEKIENLGIELIKENKFAVATMAGGQGTRLRT